MRFTVVSSRLALPLAVAAFPMAAAFASVSLVACGSSNDAAPAVDAAVALDAAVVDAPPGPVTATGAACNSLPTTGTAVPLDVVDAQAAPTATGGTIVAGSYHLTALTQYGGSLPYAIDDAGNNVAFRSIINLTISGATWQVAGSDPSNASYSNTFAVSSVAPAAGQPVTNVELDETCPDGDTSETISYTATPTSITWYVGNNQVTTASVFTMD